MCWTLRCLCITLLCLHAVVLSYPALINTNVVQCSRRRLGAYFPNIATERRYTQMPIDGPSYAGKMYIARRTKES